jgi:hypothetical protein
MGILYDTLVIMTERSMQGTRPVIGEPMWNGQPATQTDVLAWDTKHKQDKIAAVQPEVPPKPVRDIPPGSQIAWEKQYGLKYDVQGRDKSKIAATEKSSQPDTQVVQNNQNVQPGVANKDSQPQQPQQQPQQSALPPDQVKILQKALIAKGQILPPSKLAKDGVDGILGKNTFNAIMALIVGKQSTPTQQAGDVATQNNTNSQTQAESIGYSQDPTLARIIQLTR